MIIWPIFVALFLSIIAVYFSIKAENKKERRLKEDEERKQLDLLRRKKE